MFLSPLLLVRAANATFNAAAESSPILHIIYGCFSTVFLCTWTALHLDVVYPSRLFRRVGWMMIALIAPELVLAKAFNDWRHTSNLLAKILKNYPECGWTETHAQFVRMGGFRLVDANGKTFFDCVKDGTIDLPKVSKDEILARSKGDSIAKTITVIQTAWFVFQCIHRRSQHLLLTELEITTLAHTLINFFIYFCWWHKPYGVALPIEVPFKERRPETIGERDEKVESKRGSSDGNENIQVPQTTEIGENPTQPPNDNPSRTSEKGVPVATKSSDDKSPVAAAYKEVKFDVEARNYGTPSTSPQLSWYTRLGIKTFSVSEAEQLSIHGRTVVSSLIVVVIGGTSLASVIHEREISNNEALVIFFGMFAVFLLPLYCLARVSLLVLALLQLRALPYAAYATPSWTIFYPHIG
ncbi:hypothetical protein M378DRAFT_165746 [Amanita muscaria Koide BX008]|uniref:Uncharacterized protein n=1 Tax=Amanita muscaria (strain Koide BX008) TaxID=946122 RepID=A0A0C2T721_AMAMK|nr:hypothetical protein M378DRAFT_165746 [Amanita muscaria Koide BX008]